MSFHIIIIIIIIIIIMFTVEQSCFVLYNHLIDLMNIPMSGVQMSIIIT